MANFKIPKKVMALGGEITVAIVANLRYRRKKVSGLWMPDRRLIQIEESDTPREQAHTYFHELTHAALYDSGQHNLLTHDGNEAICDLMAVARLREIGL